MTSPPRQRLSPPRLGRAAWVLLALGVLGAFPGSMAVAQSVPRIAYLLPAGGQRGTTVPVAVRGRYLMGATEVHVSGQGVTGKIVAVEEPKADKKEPKRLDAVANPHLARLELTIAPDAPLGERDLRVITPGGVSNRFRFYIGPVPEVNEVEPNSLPEQAQVLPSLPCVVNGQTAQGDRDFFQFHAKAGETLVCQAYAQQILPYIADGVPGWFQASLTLTNLEGKTLAYVDDFRHHPDPILVYRVETEGDYRIAIQDALFRGRDDFVYRLSIGALPLLTDIFPLGGPRNAETQVKLTGVNLSTDTLTIKPTADSPPRMAVQTAAGEYVSNERPFAVGDLPEIVESEPNDSVEKAQHIEVPVTINGRIQAKGDADYFLFSAKAKQRLVLEVCARRLDSPLDSMLSVLDSKGQLLKENDDTIDPSEGLVTHHADSYVDYTFPADGNYVVRIADAEGLGGESYAYRLTVAPPQPDFALRIRPDNPRAPEGGTALFTVDSYRRDGFVGPIRLAIQGLPEKFVAPEVEIPEKQNLTRVAITVPAEAALGLCTPKIMGTAHIGEADVVHEALPAEELMQAFYYMHNIPTREFLLAVVERGPFTLALDLPPGEVLKIPAQGRAEVVVKATFKEGVKGEITLRPDSPPRGFKIEASPIPAGQDQTTITITTQSQDIHAGTNGSLIITATLKTDKQSIAGFVPVIPFEIVEK